MSDYAEARAWVHRKHLADDAWVVDCRLCGKLSHRVFRGDKYADTAKAADRYVVAHVKTASHRAAVAAYREPPHETFTKEEILLRSIFGAREGEKTDEQKRIAAARGAALRHSRDE